ncbi:MAG: hypothetical protein EBX52_01990 [Proteobacteria bacterium]|nr:hypothetical protein [Pseudomonadota bacterium]
MRLLFSLDEQIHEFKVTGDIAPGDLNVLKKSLLRFLDTLPPFTILDLSEASLQVPDFELQGVLVEIQTLAKAKGLHLVVAQTDIESRVARRSLMEMALLKQIEILKGKIALREEIHSRLETLVHENRNLQVLLDRSRSLAENTSGRGGVLSPLLEKLWGGP